MEHENKILKITLALVIVTAILGFGYEHYSNMATKRSLAVFYSRALSAQNETEIGNAIGALYVANPGLTTSSAQAGFGSWWHKNVHLGTGNPFFNNDGCFFDPQFCYGQNQ